ncbi:DUF6557 family protein [Dokdonia sp.]|uniref:DUF6557 family protein n=1 Tax=Dokdonia sp. TaxID=2024995 RepID=UPI003263D4CA
MTFRNLIDKSNWEDVKSSLIKAYPELKELTSHFHTVYLELTKMNPIHSDLILNIQKINSENEEEDIAVSGIGEPHEFGNIYNISGQGWEKCLGMEIHLETIKNFNESEIIAHSLYEMTFFGFTENQIKKNIEKTIN